MDVWNLRGGQYRCLTDEQLQRMHEATLELLERTGCVFMDEEAVRIFAEAGADVDPKSSRVRIPRHLVEEAIKKSPKRVTLTARNRKYDLVLEKNRVYFGTGSNAINVLGIESGRCRRATKGDVLDFARLVDALEYIHFYKIAVIPGDVPPQVAERHMVEASFNGTEKHFSTHAFTPEGAADVIRMASIVAGGENELRRNPLIAINVLALSPLKYDPTSLRILMEVARRRIPLIVASEPQAGTTAPVTLIGAALQQNAESLAGIVLAQLLSPGTPVLCGAVGMVADARTGLPASGSVELAIMNAIAAQLSQSYGIPIYGTGGLSDAKVPDAQAGYEKGIQTLLVALSGANYIHDAAGQLDLCLTESYEQMVIDNEICGMVARVLQGVTVDDEFLALEVIDRVAFHGGSFLTERHTVKHLREEHFFPKVSNRQKRKNWERLGSKDAAQAARDIAGEILEGHSPPPLPRDIQRELSRVVKGAEKKLK